VPAVTFVIGVLLGVVLTLSFTNLSLGRIFLRIFAVLCLAFGFGLVIWPAVSLALGEKMDRFDLDVVQISKPAEAFALGAGFLLGGGLSLFMSFWRSGGKPNPLDKPS
jgi:hypothetical protein